MDWPMNGWGFKAPTNPNGFGLRLPTNNGFTAFANTEPYAKGGLALNYSAPGTYAIPETAPGGISYGLATGTYQLPGEAFRKAWLEDEGLFGITNGNWGHIGTLGQLGIGAFNLWNSYQANKLNKQALAFQKEAWNKQYQNSLGSYLNQYNDILNSRAAMYGLTGDDAATYVDSQLANVENRLKTGTAATTNPNTSASNIRRDLDNDLGA